MIPARPSLSPTFPATPQSLEDVRAAGPRDMAAALVFSLSRVVADDPRLVVMAVRQAWLGEHGRPHLPGLAAYGCPRSLMMAVARTEIECLWVMEQALKSGAASLVIGTVDQASLTHTQRLDFAARQGGTHGLILRSHDGAPGSSAARRRWTVSASASTENADDRRAPGDFRLLAELTRSRSEQPGTWILEQDDGTHRLRLADRLAGDGLVESPTRRAA